MTDENWTGERLEARRRELAEGVESAAHLARDGKKAVAGGIVLIVVGVIGIGVGAVVRSMGVGVEMIGIVLLVGAVGVLVTGVRNMTKGKGLQDQAEQGDAAYSVELREVERCIATGQVDRAALFRLGSVWQCVACNSVDTGRSADGTRMCNACGYISSN